MISLIVLLSIIFSALSPMFLIYVPMFFIVASLASALLATIWIPESIAFVLGSAFAVWFVRWFVKGVVDEEK